MLKDDVTLRVAREEDAGELLAIYAPYVEKTAVSFEYEAPTVEEFRGRICRIRERYPYIVAEQNGRILGYAYASAFHERKAFDHAVEMSVYLREDRRRGGLGRRLYEALECILKEQNITDLCAWIAAPDGEDPYLTWDSIRFHHVECKRSSGNTANCRQCGKRGPRKPCNRQRHTPVLRFPERAILRDKHESGRAATKHALQCGNIRCQRMHGIRRIPNTRDAYRHSLVLLPQRRRHQRCLESRQLGNIPRGGD